LSWLQSIIDIDIDTSFVQHILNSWDKSWPVQYKVVIQSAVINILNIIWFCMNSCRFHNKKIDRRIAINLLFLMFVLVKIVLTPQFVLTW
jgi:hypothetical protein